MGQAVSSIQALYSAINQRDIVRAVSLVDEHCRYEDLNFSVTFIGKAAVEGLFTESCQAVPADLQFVIDDMAGDDVAVGVTWHVELGGNPFPNGRGVSFYRFSSESGKLVFARDCVEPPLKLGKVAFTMIRLVTPLIRLWSARQPSNPSIVVAKAAVMNPIAYVQYALWLATAIYVGLLLLSPPGWLPGEPVWAIQVQTLQEILDESLNFFFILPLLNLLGIHYLQAPVVHPASQGFFNLAEAWIFMFLPLMLWDKRSQHLPHVWFWGGAMFLTNVFLMPYMALRLNRAPEAQSVASKGRLARIFGAVGLTVGTFAVGWFFLNQPDVGGAFSRIEYLRHQIFTERVTLAFTVDIGLFWLFQMWLMGSTIAVGERLRVLRFVPFWGLGIWLVV
ncbi:MAG: nuclear transport factor 2 family protein [Cyanobacteria bacterium P01_D01_bin.156]